MVPVSAMRSKAVEGKERMTVDVASLVRSLRKNRPRKGNEKDQPKFKLANVDQRYPRNLGRKS